MVPMLLFVVALGFETVTLLIPGKFPAMNSTNMFNTSQNSDLPVIYDTNQNNMDTTDSPGTQETPTPGTPTGGSSTGGSNQNNNPPSSNNTTN